MQNLGRTCRAKRKALHVRNRRPDSAAAEYEGTALPRSRPNRWIASTGGWLFHHASDGWRIDVDAARNRRSRTRLRGIRRLDSRRQTKGADRTRGAHQRTRFEAQLRHPRRKKRSSSKKHAR
jgi:hypothetical protein